MKKMKFLFAAVIAGSVSQFAIGQVWTPNTNTTDNIYRDGNISIGNTATTPSSNIPKLKIGAHAYTDPVSFVPYGKAAELKFTTSVNDFYQLDICSQSIDGGSLLRGSYKPSGGISSDVFRVFPNGSTAIGLVGSSGTTLMLSVDGGYATIGKVGTTNSNYKLFVEQGILTEKVKVAVKNTADWSDYVFNKDYKLLSLGEVENYVQKNKHLPGVPSSEEVVKDGIDMATMDAKLLEKIEELTLYMIEMKKENEQMKKENEALKERMNVFENKKD